MSESSADGGTDQNDPEPAEDELREHAESGGEGDEGEQDMLREHSEDPAEG
ncbi:MAG: hypothetical protein JO147_13025 [Actinobacteria bacterium]|nr:hypothetical protein [Actinomycetota bacterium]